MPEEQRKFAFAFLALCAALAPTSFAEADRRDHPGRIGKGERLQRLPRKYLLRALLETGQAREGNCEYREELAQIS